MRVYIDASVIIAALLSPSGGSSKLFTYIQIGAITGITSQTVIEEVLEEDKYKKLNKSREAIEEFIVASKLVVREYIPADEIAPYQGMLDAEDVHLVAGANLSKCAYLVTLDKKHLLRPDIQEKFLPLRIASPKELLEDILRFSEGEEET